MSTNNMNNPVLDKAVEHFKNRNIDGMKEFYVKEWDTTIYYKRVGSFKDQSAVMSLHQQGKIVEALVETIVTKARTKNGTKMFALADRITLLNEADPDVLTKIATELNKVDNYDVESVAKN